MLLEQQYFFFGYFLLHERQVATLSSADFKFSSYSYRMDSSLENGWILRVSVYFLSSRRNLPRKVLANS